jgi:hypothetical protein
LAKKKFSSDTTKRNDVIRKTLSRIMRSFYTDLLTDMTQYQKRKRRNQMEVSFIGAVD